MNMNKVEIGERKIKHNCRTVSERRQRNHGDPDLEQTGISCGVMPGAICLICFQWSPSTRTGNFAESKWGEETSKKEEIEVHYTPTSITTPNLTSVKAISSSFSCNNTSCYSATFSPVLKRKHKEGLAVIHGLALNKFNQLNPHSYVWLITDFSSFPAMCDKTKKMVESLSLKQQLSCAKFQFF